MTVKEVIKIPTKVIYKKRVYRILNIDLQGGYFDLINQRRWNAKKEGIIHADIDECRIIK